MSCEFGKGVPTLTLTLTLTLVLTSWPTSHCPDLRLSGMARIPSLSFFSFIFFIPECVSECV